MKTFFSTLAGLIVVLILAGAVIGFVFWSRVPDILANNLSSKLKVSVQIDDMSLGWGKIDIKKVEVGNTPKSILSKAFSCNLIRVLAPFTHYLDKHIVIDEINLNDVYIGLEFDTAKGATGNWTEIMGNLQNAGSSGRKKKKGRQETPAASTGHTVLIHKLILTNINVDIVYRKDGGKVKHLPTIDRIELNEVSSEGGLPMDQIMNSVLGQMLRSVFEKENLKNMMQDLLPNQNNLQQYISPFKGLFTAPSLIPQSD